MTDPLREELVRSLGTAYTIERELGGGGMSRVFLARENRLGRDVVVKLLSPTLASELSAERFEREIALAASLQEPHLVPVLSAGETAGGLPYYTMPFVAGESLRARLARGRLPVGEALSILRDVARALAYAHERGVVHRDIKPENVLLSSGTAMVTDFGIAKAINVARTAAGTEDTAGTLTRTGMSIGTPAYMSPEQATGDEVDGRADVYAWGVLAYELLAGTHPFADRLTAPQLVTAHLTERPRPLAARVSELAPSLATLVMRALAKAPEERPSSPELVTALDGDGGGDRRGVRRVVAWAGAAALVLLLAAGAFAMLDRVRGDAGDAERRPAAAGPITSLAVMPFANTGGDRADDYLSDGLSDELAQALVRLPGLRVSGRASVHALRARTTTVSEIGRTLGVSAIIEGQVRRAGGRLRVTAQLTSTSDGHVLWTSDTFESRSDDVFQVQDEFTQAVVTALAPTLRGQPANARRPAMRGTENAAAYDLYLHGRYFWSRRGMANLNRAIEVFRQAAATDPAFARAHAGLAMAYVVLPYFDPNVSPDSVMPLAQASAERALALDPALADAHLALANVHGRHFRLPEARTQLLAALADAPLDPTAHAWYADYLGRIGQRDSSIAEKRRAVELEPLSAPLTNQLALALYVANRFDEATRVAHRSLEFDSTFVRGYHSLARIQLFRGFPDSALAVLETATRFGPVLAGARGTRALAYAAAGRWSDARRVRDSISADPDTRRSDGDRMLAALAFGDRAGALAALARLDTTLELPTVIGQPGCDPLLDPLHAEPQYLALMRRLGLTVCEVSAPWPVRVPPP